MNSIFISYRRDDVSITAQLLQMHLKDVFGEDSVFLDTSIIKPGEEFPVELNKAVSNSKVVVALIGKNWKGGNPQINRLEDENDWVRRELEIALQDKKKKIFPVIVKGAKIKTAFKGLPLSLEPLTFLNCIELREKEFKQDLLPLIPLIKPFIDLEDPLKDLPVNEDLYEYPKRSPFKGLDYFTEKDTKIFFGRDSEIRKLYNLIKNRKILFLYGQSGSGKSSLLFAGLKPRLEFKSWNVKYFRRESGINLAEKLNEYLRESGGIDNNLVILDQVEEIYTNPDITISSQAEAQQLLLSVKNASKNIRILISFRKEYLAELKKLFCDLPVEEVYLMPMQIKGILDAITGVTKSIEARDNYELSYSDESLPVEIAQTVLGDKESNAAPLLQVLLRKMWDKVENKKPRVFTKELFEVIKSNNLRDFINDQISAMKEKYEVEVNSGMVLDILYFFTTGRGTAAFHSNEDLTNSYAHSDILNIANELKNKYLLSEPINDDPGHNIIRLAHDSLAPIIRELYGQSYSASQRALRLLESKKQDLIMGNDVDFSKTDLDIIDAGRSAMRKITDIEIRAIESSRKRIQDDDAEKKRIYEIKQEEEQRKQFEEREINSILISNSPQYYEIIVRSIEHDFLLVTGDRLAYDNDNNSFWAYCLSKIKEREPYFLVDKKTNLVSFTGQDIQIRKYKFKHEFRKCYLDFKYDEKKLNKISQIPFTCNLNFSFDDHLIRSFENQSFKFHFAFNGFNENVQIKIGLDRMTLTENIPLLYNVLGTIKGEDIPLTLDDMNRQINSLNNFTKLPLKLRSLMKSARIVVFLGFNWNAWYIQSLVRSLIEYNHRGKDVFYFTVRDNIKIENVNFIRSMDIKVIDTTESDFIDLLHERCQNPYGPNILRKPN
jgi:hypothetical protein